jgi:hypothetical protein
MTHFANSGKVASEMPLSSSVALCLLSTHLNVAVASQTSNNAPRAACHKFKKLLEI